jgi:hypothetical protein
MARPQSCIFEVVKSGSNKDIWKCRIEGDFAIPNHWEFAAKSQKGATDMVQKIQFNVEAIALWSPHDNCIK